MRNLKPQINIDRLKEKREQRGWSKLEASEYMGMPQSVYLRYESGERSPSYTALRDMALTLGTTVEYLTGKTDDDSPDEYIVSAKDKQLVYIIETYNNAADAERQRLYNYAKKLTSS